MSKQNQPSEEPKTKPTKKDQKLINGKPDKSSAV